MKQGLSLTLFKDWNVEYHSLPSHESHHHHYDNSVASSSSASSSATSTSRPRSEGILLTSIPLSRLYNGNQEACTAFIGTNSSSASRAKAAKVALADYAARILGQKLPQKLTDSNTNGTNGNNGHNSKVQSILQTMGQAKHLSNSMNEKQRRYSQRKNPARNKMRRIGKNDWDLPFVLERTDCMVVRDGTIGTGDGTGEDGRDVLQFFLHVTLVDLVDPSTPSAPSTPSTDALSEILSPLLEQLTTELSSTKCFTHIASVVLQRQLRSMLQAPHAPPTPPSSDADSTTEEKNDPSQTQIKTDNHNNYYLDAVAFIADGSLLPRKSGRSIQPMSSPPAIPFVSPEGSEQLTRVVTVEVGAFWRRFLKEDGSVRLERLEQSRETDMEVDSTENASNEPSASSASTDTTVTMRGMIIPRGVTLIVGGGYHGKSTLLQALSVGVYDKIPGDGRERCVTHEDAVSIRAEDGRYVNQCNVSAFISNLPGGNKDQTKQKKRNGPDTTRFSTKDASGSTSQAANVMEALESRASTLLVDEDVSAANFMARDGRMRALIMDEPITPLLYRVNGLYLSKEHRVSTVVVVGGVGEWLDVADAVVLMKEYVAYDGLEKAKSVSYQFSYGHVQYAGRGVVHRLPWNVKEDTMGQVTIGVDGDGKPKTEGMPTTLSPLRRRPASVSIAEKFRDAAVHLYESSSSRLWFYRDDEKEIQNGNDTGGDDEDDGIVDMSKCSQLVGNASEQLYGCGICILWLLQQSKLHPEEDLSELLDRMDQLLDNGGVGGMNSLLASLEASDPKAMQDMVPALLSSHAAYDLWETVGFVYRPRRHEVAMALTRMRGMKFDILPEKKKDTLSKEEEEKKLEEERKKKALADLWNNRRKK